MPDLMPTSEAVAAEERNFTISGLPDYAVPSLGQAQPHQDRWWFSGILDGPLDVC